MPRRNRIDPWGDMHAVEPRGMFTGNRGCLVDESSALVRHHRSNLWITCVTSFRDWRHPLDRPGIWTPLFFLDDAVALAAGHRPCGFCRRPDYVSYRDAVTRAHGAERPFNATELNRMLATERLRRGSGIDRGGDRKTWPAHIDDLPDNTVIVDAGEACVVVGDRIHTFGHEGWSAPDAGPHGVDVEVLTPPTSVSALRQGYVPVLHPSLHSFTNG